MRQRQRSREHERAGALQQLPSRKWTLSPVVTSGGILIFANGTSDATFRAILNPNRVPEPATLLLLAVGLTAIGFGWRKVQP